MEKYIAEVYCDVCSTLIKSKQGTHEEVVSLMNLLKVTGAIPKKLIGEEILDVCLKCSKVD